jgi:peptidoglycan/LPS O-acetylase OafA/YrhL
MTYRILNGLGIFFLVLGFFAGSWWGCLIYLGFAWYLEKQPGADLKHQPMRMPVDSTHPRKTLADYAGTGPDNTKLIRMILAVIIIFVHSYALLGIANTGNPLTNFVHNSGEDAVNTFFLISGFFIVSSYLGKDSLDDFIFARTARLIPALFVIVTVTVLLVGPCFTQMSPGEYFIDRETLKYWYKNVFLIHTEYDLPGVFSNHINQALNGSLWTIRYEAKMYIMVAVLGSLGVFKSRHLIVAACLLYFSWYLAGLFRPDWFADFPEVFHRVSLYFILGGLMRCYAHVIPLRWMGLVILAGFHFLWGRNSSLAPLSLAVLMVYGTFCFAYLSTKGIGIYNRLGDYSYGTYLFAFPIQQMLIALHPGIHPITLFFSASLITISFAVLSWHYIEKPCMDYNKALSKKRHQQQSALLLSQ